MAAGAADGQGSLDEHPELKGLIAELIVEGGRESVAKPASSRPSGCNSSWPASTVRSSAPAGSTAARSATLAGERAEVKRQFDRAYGRVLEETGEREY